MNLRKQLQGGPYFITNLYFMIIDIPKFRSKITEAYFKVFFKIQKCHFYR